MWGLRRGSTAETETCCICNIVQYARTGPAADCGFFRRAAPNATIHDHRPGPLPCPALTWPGLFPGRTQRDQQRLAHRQRRLSGHSAGQWRVHRHRLHRAFGTAAGQPAVQRPAAGRRQLPAVHRRAVPAPCRANQPGHSRRQPAGSWLVAQFGHGLPIWHPQPQERAVLCQPGQHGRQRQPRLENGLRAMDVQHRPALGLAGRRGHRQPAGIAALRPQPGVAGASLGGSCW